MATAALAVRVRGTYREVEGGGYARASGEAAATFPAATATWGVVRAYAVADGSGEPEWVALATPVLVGRGQRASLDLATGALQVAGAVLAGAGSGMAALTAGAHEARVTGAGAPKGDR